VKLRIQANSIRFRITPTELNALATRGAVESSVQFGTTADERFTYALESSAQCSSVCVKYTDRALRVILPTSEVREWASTEQVGIEGVQTAGSNSNLRILIEKDFKCLQPRPDESEVDRFPNPADN
jgi:hypothetical protein